MITKAMPAPAQPRLSSKGGIDLDPVNFKMNVQGKARGIVTLKALQHIDQAQISGFTPVIIEIVPATALPFDLPA